MRNKKRFTDKGGRMRCVSIVMMAAMGVVPMTAHAMEVLNAEAIVVCASTGDRGRQASSNGQEAFDGCEVFRRGVFADDLAGLYTSFVHRMESAGLVDDDGHRVKFGDLAPARVVTIDEMKVGCGLEKQPLGELETVTSRCLKRHAFRAQTGYVLAWEVVDASVGRDGFVHVEATLWGLERRAGATGGLIARTAYFVVQNDSPSLLITDALREAVRHAVTGEDPNASRHASISDHLGGQTLMVFRSKRSAQEDGSVNALSISVDGKTQPYPADHRVVSTFTDKNLVNISDADGSRSIRLGIGVRPRIWAGWVSPYVGTRIPTAPKSAYAADDHTDPGLAQRPWYKEPSIWGGAAGVAGGTTLVALGGLLVTQANECVRGIGDTIPLPEANAQYGACTENVTLARVYVGLGAALVVVSAALPVIELKKRSRTDPQAGSASVGVTPLVGGAGMRFEGRF